MTLQQWSNVKEFIGENPDVKKFVFEKDDACVEAVLYKYGEYEERTVLCISTQCGCPVGCIFCGTGKKFVRNLTSDEISEQVDYVISKIENEISPTILGTSFKQSAYSLNNKCKKFQIMFMSMGEPMLNWENVKRAIYVLNQKYKNAQLLVSTVGIDDDDIFKDVIRVSKLNPKIGLQFSVHSISDIDRNDLIPFKNKMNLYKLRDAGLMWWKATGRQVYLNFCLEPGGWNIHELNAVHSMFSPLPFALTFSVICENEEGKVKSEEDKRMSEFAVTNAVAGAMSYGYNVRAFDPAGQEVGAGCGQLFYVQSWMKKHDIKGPTCK